MLAVIKNLIKPKGKVFYTCFLEAAYTIDQMAALLIEMAKTTNYELRIQKSQEIELLENKNDELTHKVFVDLHSIFLTPISREDICDLTGQLDDVADFIFACSRSIIPIKMEKTGSDKLLFAQCLGRLCNCLVPLLSALEKKDLQGMQKCVLAMRKLEHEADDLYDYAMRNLFLEESDFKDFIRSREVFINMKELADKCEIVANTVDSLSWKQAVS
jgi:uncharacterized protein